MSNEQDKNRRRKTDSKTKKKVKNLSAVERRRLEREGREEETRFSPFEARQDEPRRKSREDSSFDRYAAFEKKSDEDYGYRDEYFDKHYGFPSTDFAGKRGTSDKENIEKKKKSSTSNPQAKPEEEYLRTPAKIKKLTAKQRKFRTRLGYAAAFVVFLLVAVLLSVTVLFKTTEIIVEGENIPYTSEEIIEVSGIDYGDNIFLSKKKAAVKKIVDAFPYIENAEISMKIPGTQIIKVDVAVASFEVAVNGGYAIVSTNGRILEKIDSPTYTIPLLKGLKITDTEVGQYITFEKNTTQQVLSEVINSIHENNVPNIYGIDISNTADIELNYDNRITISLGVPEDVGYKLRTAMAIINNELAPTDKGNLDVSLANSDRKSSYFTPIYSNTVTIDENTSGSSVLPNTQSSVSSNTQSNDTRN